MTAERHVRNFHCSLMVAQHRNRIIPLARITSRTKRKRTKFYKREKQFCLTFDDWQSHIFYIHNEIRCEYFYGCQL